MFEEEKQEEKNALQEVSAKVAINPEDCAGAAEFWKHFNINMPAELKEAFETFAKESTYERQKEVTLAITKAIGYEDEEPFRDEMFKEIVEECKDKVYDLNFDKSLEATLDKEEDNKQS